MLFGKRSGFFFVSEKCQQQTDTSFTDKHGSEVKSRILRPFTSTVLVPFRVYFGHMRTAAETDVRGKQF